MIKFTNGGIDVVLMRKVERLVANTGNVFMQQNVPWNEFRSKVSILIGKHNLTGVKDDIVF